MLDECLRTSSSDDVTRLTPTNTRSELLDHHHFTGLVLETLLVQLTLTEEVWGVREVGGDWSLEGVGVERGRGCTWWGLKGVELKA